MRQELCTSLMLSIEMALLPTDTDAPRVPAFCRPATNGAASNSLPFDLSERELMVMRHAASGAKKPEIAALAALTEKQLEGVIESAFGKAGASNMMQMLARCCVLGVI